MTFDISVAPQQPASTSTSASGPSVLMDLRHCYEGYAGIPQEARLLFSMFSNFPLKRFGGLASGIWHTSRHQKATSVFEKLMQQNRALVSQDVNRKHVSLITRLSPGPMRKRVSQLSTMLSEAFRREKLDLSIDPEVFNDYLWVRLFDRTLAPEDRQILRRAEFFATEMGHESARALTNVSNAFQRRLESQQWNVFFAPYLLAYRLPPETKAIVRYYDALPLVSPHTVGDPWIHGQQHGRNLLRNIKQGVTIYCDSEPVRGDLLRFFPQAEAKIHTIPCVVAPEYRPDDRPADQVRAILRRRANASSANGKSSEGTSKLVGTRLNKPLPKLFMAVSSLEPRKNYLKLFHAFEIAKRMTSQDIQLVVVANVGWRAEAELAELKVLVREGVHHLGGVPLSELRILYSAAHCVVTPSRAEGFDYAGVEAMACGTPVIASDIPVHKWVYGEAAEYFDPYDEEALARLMVRMAELPAAQGHLATMRQRGFRQAALYSRDTLAPRWEEAICKVAAAPAMATA